VAEMATPRAADSMSRKDEPYKIEVRDEDCFVIYSSHDYRSFRRSQPSVTNSVDDEKLGELNDCHPIKIHISIHEGDVARVQIELIQLLLAAIAEGIIHQFKHTNLDIIMKQLAWDNDNIEKAALCKQYLVDGLVEIPADKQNIIKEWEELKAKFEGTSGACRRYDHEDFLDRIDRYAKESKEKIERLVKGSQFTIYLPVKHDLAKVALLQNNISKLLSDRKASAGRMVKTQSPIDPFVSIRKDKLDGYYVDALIENEKAVVTLQQEQTESKLYNYLMAHKADEPKAFPSRELHIKKSDNPKEDPFVKDYLKDLLNKKTKIALSKYINVRFWHSDKTQYHDILTKNKKDSDQAYKNASAPVKRVINVLNRLKECKENKESHHNECKSFLDVLIDEAISSEIKHQQDLRSSYVTFYRKGHSTFAKIFLEEIFNDTTLIKQALLDEKLEKRVKYLYGLMEKPFPEDLAKGEKQHMELKISDRSDRRGFDNN
jgi:hypothetical protein